MEISGFIKRIITVVTFITALIYFTIQMFNIENYQNNDVNRILDKLNSELNSSGFTDYTIQSIDKGSFVCLFVKNPDGKMIPMIYNKTFFGSVNPDPINVYKSYQKTIRIYEKNIAGRNFVVWINKFNANYYMKYLLIPALVILLIYLVIMLVITLLNGNRPLFNAASSSDEDYNSEDDDTELYEALNSYDNQEMPEDEIEHSLPSDSHEEYINLWSRNFKISDDFKSGFPFIKLLRHIKFSYVPEEYIAACIATASEYFKWDDPKVFISQKDSFIECTSREILDKEIVTAAKDGMVKGNVFIPLYPYSKSKIFGYLNFQWNNEEPFFISDILYFLKFAFSPEARNIFANHKNNLAFKDRIDNLIKENEDLSIAVIEVDSKEKYKAELNQDEKNILNMKVLDDIIQEFNGSIVFEAFNFVYLLIKPVDKSTFYDELKLFMDNKDRNYYISPLRGNVAVTFSAGIAGAGGRNINSKELIEEAELQLDSAISNGGDQISG